MKKLLLILLAIVGVGGGMRIAFEVGFKDGEKKARHFRSALQDYGRIAGEARMLLTKYLTGDLKGKADNWVNKSRDMDRKYSVLIGQTPRDDGSRPTLDEVVAEHEERNDLSMYQGTLVGDTREAADTI